MTERPTRYYVFETDTGYKIVPMTDDIALDQFWQKGLQWVDMPKGDREEAEQLVAALLAEGDPTR